MKHTGGIGLVFAFPSSFLGLFDSGEEELDEKLRGLPDGASLYKALVHFANSLSSCKIRRNSS